MDSYWKLYHPDVLADDPGQSVPGGGATVFLPPTGLVRDSYAKFSLYFWRDATGREIDVVIDTGERVIPLEASSGRTVAVDAVDALAWWRSIPSNPNGGGILVHGGAESFVFKGCGVLPWFPC